MSLADDVLGILPDFQEDAESLMVDDCLVERRSGQVTDPVTGVVSDSWVTLYEGRCKVQGRSTVASERIAGGLLKVGEQLQVHFPVGQSFRLDDRVTITDTLLNPDLVGNKYRLTEMARGSIRTADRWNVEHMTS